MEIGIGHTHKAVSALTAQHTRGGAHPSREGGYYPFYISLPLHVSRKGNDEKSAKNIVCLNRPLLAAVGGQGGVQIRLTTHRHSQLAQCWAAIIHTTSALAQHLQRYSI